MKIYILGFMGSGKSTVGNELAQELKYDFFDLDKYIEEREGDDVRTIFEDKGEAFFRKIEAKYLRETEKLKNIVIATGGGTPCFYENIGWMNKNGLTIFLKASVDLLEERLKGERSERPLLKNIATEELRQYIKNTVAQRDKYYNQAKVKVWADDLNIEDLAENIKSI